MTYATPHANPHRIGPILRTDLWFGTEGEKWLNPVRNQDGSERDSQRARVYAAEQKVFGTMCEAELCDPAEFVDILTSRRDFQRVYGCDWNVVVSEMPRTEESATGVTRGLRRGRIQIPKWAANPPMICHELAHCITPPWVAHGPLFCYIYLDLLALVGMDGLLCEEFFRKKVRTDPWT